MKTKTSFTPGPWVTDGKFIVQEVDDFTKNHLHAWILNNLPSAEWNKAERKMLSYVESEPESLDLGWWKVYDAIFSKE